MRPAIVRVVMVGVFIQGLVLGALAGIPLGPASAAVADTAIRIGLARALSIGLGASLVDFLFCLLAATGSGLLVEDNPELLLYLRLAGGAILVGYGTWTLTRPPPDLANMALRRPLNVSGFISATTTGVIISALNPGLMTTWILLGGTVLAGFSTSHAIVVSLGVFLGTFAWFLVVGQAAHRGRALLGHRVVWVTRIAGIILVAFGVLLLANPSLTWLFDPNSTPAP
jgi:putative LysE/RhtB family amino acid efflux pump